MWPTHDESIRFNQMIRERSPLAGFAGAWGMADGMSIDVQEPFGNPEKQNALYNAWPCKDKISNILVFAVDDTTVYANLHKPGKDRLLQSWPLIKGPPALGEG